MPFQRSYPLLATRGARAAHAQGQQAKGCVVCRGADGVLQLDGREPGELVSTLGGGFWPEVPELFIPSETRWVSRVPRCSERSVLWPPSVERVALTTQI